MVEVSRGSLAPAVLSLLLLALAGPPPTAAWLDAVAPPDGAARADPTGTRFVYLEVNASRELDELWSVPLAGGTPTRLSGALAPGDRIGAFSISPDGRWVAFTVARGGGPPHLFVTAAGGGSPVPVDPPRTPESAVGRFAFRPDSEALGFVLERPPGGPEAAPEETLVVLLAGAIYANDFESGDTSLWADTTAPQCPAPTGGPTLHANSVPANETWTANGSPHVLTANVTVPAGVTLTVSPCAELRLRSNVSLTVQGTLVARGTPLQRIAIRRDDPALAFASIWVRSPGFADLAYADLSGGGSTDAALLVEGVDSPLALPAMVDHVKVTGSAGYGVRLYRSAGFSPSSRFLVVSGSGAAQPASPFPVRLGQTALGTLPTGTYTGNASDLVQVIASADVVADLTIHDRGIPYQIGGGGSFGILTVNGNPGLATLTIEPGVEIRFFTAGSNVGGLFVKDGARLVAAGTAGEPILFTGAGGAPAAGSWEGVTFSGALAPDNLLDHVRIDAAGAPGGDQGFGCPPDFAGNQTNGALKLFTQPSAQFLVNSTISNSSSHGVFRAWTGGLVDFLPGNSFANIAFCQQVLPHPPLPASCPVAPECPQ